MPSQHQNNRRIAGQYPILLLIVLCFSCGVPVIAKPYIYFDQVFASYTLAASAVEEKVYLDHFAIALERDPEVVGIVRYFHATNDTNTKVKLRASKAREYLIQKLKIDAKRLCLVDGGDLPVSSTIELDFSDK